MIQNEVFQVERDCPPRWRHVVGSAISWSVLGLFCIMLLAPLEAVAQNNKNKARKSAAKSKEKEPDAKPAEKEVADDEPKFTAEQIEKAKSKFTSADEAFGVGAAHHNSRNYAAAANRLRQL